MLRTLLLILLLLPLGLTLIYDADSHLLRLLGAGLAQVLVFWLILTILQSGNRKAHPLTRLTGVLLFVGCGLFQVLRLVSFYFQGESFNQRFFFHFNIDSLTEAGAAYLVLQLCVAVYLLTLGAFSWYVLGKHRSSAALSPTPAKPAALVVALLLLLVIEPDLSAMLKWRYQNTTAEELLLSRIDWEALDLNRQALVQEGENYSAGKNLVLVYLESLEQTYFDQERFPGLVPNLTELREEALNFTSMRQIAGTGWTVGGIVGSQCGVPLLTSLDSVGNDLLQNGFLNEAQCLADVLAAAGYRQDFMGGASTEFAGKGSYLRQHGYDRVQGREELLPLIPDPAYLSGWGLYDDDLFSLAVRRFRELGENGQPFNLTLLTLDTHHPDGEASRSCAPYEAIDNSILHAVHCTDFLLGRFIQALQQEAAWSDSLVVLFSDHLAMRNAAQGFYPPDEQRKLFFSVLNAGRRGDISRAGTHLDVAPTILSLLGIDPPPQFLAGANLLAADPQPEVPADQPERLNVLAAINTRLLTATESVCASEVLLELRDDRLLVGGHPVTLSQEGNRTDVMPLASSHALLVVLRPDGSVSLTLSVDHVDLSRVLYQLRDEVMLVVGRNTGIISRLTPATVPADALVALMGRTEINVLGVFATLPELRVTEPRCDDLLARASIADLPSAWPGPADLCLNFNPAIDNRLDPVSGTIELGDVVMDDLLYRAQLAPLGNERYRGRIVEARGAVDPGTVTECHALMEDRVLYIPQLSNENRYQSLVLETVPDQDLVFSLVEKADL